MEIFLVILVAVVAVVLIAALAMAPMLKKRGDEAIYAAKDLVGGSVTAIEQKVVGLGSNPAKAEGMGVLAASTDKLAFVTWAPRREWVIDRSSITKVDTAAADAGATEKTTIQITFVGDEGEEVAQFRLKEGLHDFLDELDYDWGPEGRPDLDDEDS